MFDEGSEAGRGLGPTAGFPVDDPLAMVANTRQMMAAAEVSALLHTVDWLKPMARSPALGSRSGAGRHCWTSSMTSRWRVKALHW